MFLIRRASRFLLPLVLLLATTMAVAQGRKVYSLAVVPQLTPTEIHRTWTPIAEKLSRATGQQFELKIYTSIPKFEAAFLDGKIDLAFMNPYHALMAKRAQGYIPLLRDDANPLTGILVVQRDSPIKSIKELNGKALAFPAPNSFGASLHMRALLTEQEKISITPTYLKTHSNVYRHVIVGEAAAGGAVNNTLKREPPEVQAELRVLFETPGVPSHPLGAHPRMPERLRQAVTNTLLEMQNDPAGQKLLVEIQIPKPVKADYARDYQPLEKLKLEKYVVIEKD